MSKTEMDNINVYRVNITGNTVSIITGFCEPASRIDGKIIDSSVKEVNTIRFPVSVLSGIVKQLVEAGVAYQRECEDIGLEINDDDPGMRTVRI